jgi:hypothetical protein
MQDLSYPIAPKKMGKKDQTAIEKSLPFAVLSPREFRISTVECM